MGNPIVPRWEGASSGEIAEFFFLVIGLPVIVILTPLCCCGLVCWCDHRKKKQRERQAGGPEPAPKARVENTGASTQEPAALV